MNITTLREGKRGCGYRKAGGLYLVSDGVGRHCGALPIPLDVCPCCHAGIKPARGWTWVDLQLLRNNKPCVQTEGPNYCNSCPFFSIKEAGLLWVGERYYPMPEDFTREGAKMGFSRRIHQIPHRFKLGETWVAFAHRKAILTGETFQRFHDLLPVPEYKAGIFHIFQPRAIEYVLKADDDKDKLEALEKRGITLVKVIPVGEQSEAA